MDSEWSRERRYTRLEAVSETQLKDLEARASGSIWRQKWHVQPPSGLLNDPNGFCVWNGRYRLCYQWFPLGPVHGLKHWRGLSSPDAVHWKDEGLFISPDTPFDSHGAYSGSAWPCGDDLLIAYTGNVRDEEWRRTPHQILALYNGQSLHKQPPFLSGTPEGYTDHVRDPKIWREESGWAVVLGAQRANETGAALVYRSKDLQRWWLDGEMELGLPRFGYMWECPDFFSLDGKDVLLFCPQGVPPEGLRRKNPHLAGYVIGEYEPHSRQFAHDGFAELDLGFDFYAPQSTTSPTGERLLIGWMGLPDTRYPSDADGWSGCLSLPRVLSVENGRLRQRPLPALASLRRGSQELSGSFTGVLPLKGTSYELNFFPKHPTGDFVIALRSDALHATVLRHKGGVFSFERSESGPLPTPEKDLPLDKDNTLRQVELEAIESLQIFVDTSSVEIFINDGEFVLSGRIFPPEEADGIEVFGAGQLQFHSLKQQEIS